jgi:hypothetical protein
MRMNGRRRRRRGGNRDRVGRKAVEKNTDVEMENVEKQED